MRIELPVSTQYASPAVEALTAVDVVGVVTTTELGVKDAVLDSVVTDTLVVGSVEGVSGLNDGNTIVKLAVLVGNVTIVFVLTSVMLGADKVLTTNELCSRGSEKVCEETVVLELVCGSNDGIPIVKLVLPVGSVTSELDFMMVKVGEAILLTVDRLSSRDTVEVFETPAVVILFNGADDGTTIVKLALLVDGVGEVIECMTDRLVEAKPLTIDKGTLSDSRAILEDETDARCIVVVSVEINDDEMDVALVVTDSCVGTGTVSRLIVANGMSAVEEIFPDTEITPVEIKRLLYGESESLTIV